MKISSILRSCLVGTTALLALNACSDKEEQAEVSQAAVVVDYAHQIEQLRQELSALSPSSASMVLAEKKIFPKDFLSNLRTAIGEKDETLIKTLIVAGALKNAKSTEIASVLNRAVSNAEVPVTIVQLLLAGGVGVNDADSDGLTPLFYAMQATSQNTEALNLLKSLGATYGNPLQTAVLYGDLVAAEAALQSGCSINDGGANNFTPLCLSLASPNPDVIAWVIGKGADVNAPLTPSKMPPIFMAARLGSATAVSELVKAGVDVNQRDSNEDTPLIRACRSSKKAHTAIQVLLESGADVNAVNKQKRSPLHMLASDAFHMTAVEDAKLLIAKGADVNAPDVDGVTPLMSLCTSLSLAYDEELDYDKEPVIAMFKLFIDSGADVNAEKKSGDVFITKHGSRQSKLKMTPLAYAQKYRAVECIRMLKAAGAK